MLITLSLNLHNKRRGPSPCACFKHSSTSSKKKVLKAFFNTTLSCKQTCKLLKYVLKESKNRYFVRRFETIWIRVRTCQNGHATPLHALLKVRYLETKRINKSSNGHCYFTLPQKL